MELRVRTSTVGDCSVVALDGSADLATAPALHRALQDAGGGNAPTVVVDIDALVSLGDVALGLLIGLATRLREAGRELVVVCSAPRLLDRLERTRVDRIVTVRSSIAGSRTDPPHA